MEPTVDMDLSPQPSVQQRVERVIALGITLFVIMVLASLISARCIG